MTDIDPDKELLVCGTRLPNDGKSDKSKFGCDVSEPKEKHKQYDKQQSTCLEGLCKFRNFSEYC